MSKSLFWVFTHRNTVKAAILILVIGTINLISASFYSPKPIEVADVVILVNNSSYGPVVMEVRKYIGINSGESINSTKYFYKESNPSEFFQVESGSFKQMKGEFPVVSTTTLPKWVTGRWCVSTELSWWPAMSQREFYLKTKDVCFETSDYE